MTPLDLPDLPRWVSAHGIAAAPTSWRRELGGGFAVGNDAAQLIVVVGDPDILAIAQLAAERPAHAVLLARADATLATAVAGTHGVAKRAMLLTLPSLDELPDHDGAVVLPDTAPLDHLRREVAEEIRAARVNGEVWSAWVDGLPVAFAHAVWRSVAHSEISVDVDPSARQLGLGALVASALIHAETATGRAAVWGADEGNVASRRLARRLGFVETDELWVIVPRALVQAPRPAHLGRAPFT